MKPNQLAYFLFGIGLTTLVFLFVFPTHIAGDSDSFFSSKAQHFDFKLSEARAFMHATLEEVGGKLEQDTSQSNLLFSLSDSPYGLFLYRGKQLRSWNSNKWISPEYYSLDRAIKFYVNGYYLFDTVHVKEHVLAGVFKIKDEFQVENSNISNDFSSQFELPGEFQIDVKSEVYDHQHQIIGSEAPTLYLSWQARPVRNTVLLFLELIALSFCMLGIVLLVNWSAGLPLLMAIFWITGIVGFRLILMLDGFLGQLKQYEIFQPELFAASDLIPSLGDLFLHTLTLLFIGKIVHNNWSAALIKASLVLPQWLRYALVLMGLYSSGFLSTMILQSLVNDSTISFDLRDFSQYGLGLFISLFIVLSICKAWLFLVNHCITGRSSTPNPKQFVLVHLVVLLLFLVFSFLLDLPLINTLWMFPIISIYYWKLGLNATSEKRWVLWPELVIITMLFGGMVHSKSVTLQKDSLEREVLQLSEERNLLAEFLIESAGEQLMENSVFFMVDSLHQTNLLFQNQYLKYLTDFEFSIEETEQVKTEFSLLPLSQRLFQISGQNRMHYVLRLNGRRKTFWVHFETVDIPVNKGFPSVLANKDIEKLMLNPRYASAKYAEGQLIYTNGNYAYAAFWNRLVEEGSVKLYQEEGFLHAVIARHGKVYLVSESMLDWRDGVGVISALFFVGLFLRMGTKWVRDIYYTGQFLPASLTGRFQLYLLLILFVSTTIVALGTVNYMQNQFKRSNAQALKEKLNLIRAEIQDLEGAPLNPEVIETIGGRHGVDLFVYSSSGRLIGSSQEKLFDWGLQTELINPSAYHQIRNASANQAVEEEAIGNLTFMSAYAPTFDVEGALSHLINVPYFAKTDEINLEISNFFSSLINLYLLFTAISILLGLLLASRIAKPLQLIQNQMTRINFAGKNEKIRWDSKDEIGALVQQYNLMVEELEGNVKRLASAERETAWKEMAQQVAHEIKNPLTPMKLRLQYLRQQYSSMSEEEQTEAIHSLTENLVAQIDTLTNIANEFSNFARLKVSRPEALEVVGLVKGQLVIHSATTNAKVMFQSTFQKQLIYFDKDHLIRVFNNLMRNALQAIDDSEGVITIRLAKQDDKIRLSIQDNGTGIPSDIREKVFEPNFTTKSSGMGLGLAMVKRMIEQGGARISFETKIDHGTTFYIDFPPG